MLRRIRSVLTIAAAQRIAAVLLLSAGFCAPALAQTSTGHTGGETVESHQLAAPSAGSPEYTAAWLSYIATELRQLHLEILEDLQEILKGRIKDLEQELQSVQSRQQREQRLQAQELAEIEARLQQPNLDRVEREDLESRRSELQGLSMKLAGPQSEPAQRETEARQRLAVLQQRLQIITERSQQLVAGR